MSFAPDGTQAGDRSSALFESLNSELPTAVWQGEILRALQTWAVETNVNIGLVADGGQPFNSLGFKQGDLRFGDIRIGAYPMAGDVLAVANPYDPFVVNTWVGDVFLNSDYRFDVGGKNGAYDLFSVMLHEAGHVLGLGHSDDPASPMYEHFHNAQTGLTADDVAFLQQLYGTRRADAYDAQASNDDLATATSLQLDDRGRASIAADLTTLQDVDMYRIAVPNGAKSIDVDLHAAGISLLAARVSIVDSAGRVVATSAAAGPQNNDVVVNFDGVQAGSKYYVRVEKGADNVFGVGTYELNVGAVASTTDVESAVDDAPGTSTLGVDNESSPLSPTTLALANLLATTPGYVEHSYYELAGTLSTVTREHVYRVHSVDIGPAMTNVMTVVVDAYGASNVQVAVFDDAGQVVPAKVIARHGDELGLQVIGVESNRDYYVRIHGDQYPIPTDFELEVDFAQDATHLEQLAVGRLAAGEVQTLRSLNAARSSELHWVLSTSDWSMPQETGLQMTVFDAAGRAVYTLNAADGASRGGDLFLAAGSYTLRFARANGDVNTPVNFTLSGMTLSESLGPQLRDTTQTPADSGGNAAALLTAYWSPGASSAFGLTSINLTPSGEQRTPGASPLVRTSTSGAPAPDRPYAIATNSSLFRASGAGGNRASMNDSEASTELGEESITATYVPNSVQEVAPLPSGTPLNSQSGSAVLDKSASAKASGSGTSTAVPNSKIESKADSAAEGIAARIEEKLQHTPSPPIAEDSKAEFGSSSILANPILWLTSLVPFVWRRSLRRRRKKAVKRLDDLATSAPSAALE